MNTLGISGGGIGQQLASSNRGRITLGNDFEDELKRRMALAQQQGWDPKEIQRSALIERAVHNQQAQQQQQTQQQAPAEKPKASGLKRFLVNTGALIGETGVGIAGALAAPVTGGASIAGAFAGGAGIEALRRKMLGEQQSLGGSAVEGALTAIPVVGAAGRAFKAGRAAKDVKEVVQATDRTATIAPKLISKQAPGMTTADAFNAPGRGSKNVDFGISPFRGTPSTKIADTQSYFGNTRAKGFANSMANTTADHGVQLNQLDHSAGLWEGSVEPSFSGSIKGTPSSIRSYLSSHGSKYNQDGVITFTKDARGSGNKYVFSVKNPQKAVDALGQYGISGATVKGNEVHILDFSNELADNIKNYSKAIGSKPTITKGRVELLGKEDYANHIKPGPAGASTGDGVLLHPEDGLQPGTAAGAGIDAAGSNTAPSGLNIRDMFRPDAPGFISSKTTGRMASFGGDTRARARGVEAGLKPEGAPGRLDTAGADEINQFLNSNNVKGSARKQLGKVGTIKQQAGEQLNTAIEKNNVPLQAADNQAMQAAAKQNILGVNGKGVPGYDPRLHSPITEGYDRLLSSATDTRGLTNFKQSLDADVMNYGRNSAAADPIKEQIAREYRKVVADKIKAVDTTGEITAANKMYSQASKAEKALLVSKKLTPKGTIAGTTIPGSIGAGIENVGDKLGRIPQKIDNVVRTPAFKQLASQYGLRLLADPNAVSPTGQDVQPAAGMDINSAFGDTTDPNAAGAASSVDPNNPDSQAIDYLMKNGATDFNSIADGLSQIDSVGSGSGGTGTGGSYSSDELFQAAIKAFQAGDSKASDQFLQLASFAQAQEATAAKSGSGDKITIAQQKDVASVKNASGLLDAIEQQFSEAGGGKGILGYASHIPVFGKYINSSLGAYNQTKIDAAVAYAQALAGSGRQPAEQIIMEVKNALPSPEDTPAIARQKLANLRMHLGHREQTVLNYPYSSGDLQNSQDTIDQLLQGNGYGSSATGTDLYSALGLN